MGGRINISFDANNKEEINEIHKLLQNEIKVKFNGGMKIISGQLDLNHQDLKRK